MRATCAAGSGPAADVESSLPWLDGAGGRKVARYFESGYGRRKYCRALPAQPRGRPDVLRAARRAADLGNTFADLWRAGEIRPGPLYIKHPVRGYVRAASDATLDAPLPEETSNGAGPPSAEGEAA